MIIAFQIVLIFTILIGLFGVIGERENDNLRDNLSLICVAAMAVFIVSVVWL